MGAGSLRTMKIKWELVFILIGLGLLLWRFNSWASWLAKAPCSEILASQIKMADVPVRCLAK